VRSTPRPAIATLILAVGGLGILAAACSGGGDGGTAEPRTGPQIYRAICATCHGRDGAGFVGPSLYDVATKYPDVADQVAIVTNGRAQMPGFAGRLSPDQINRVVEYTRAEFVTQRGTPTTVAIGPTLPTTTRG
jgi:mono/diheme cytochrome c family protein